jgi:hypothetical protein
MKNANELRIGNWVIQDGQLSRVLSICDGDVKHCVIANGGRSVHGSWEPIPLTPEILVKCGFEQIESGDMLYGLWSHQDTELFLELKWPARENGFWPQIMGETERFLIAEVSVKYLHQLQNLIFSLSQTEINIQL